MLALFGAARKAAGTSVEMRKSNELISWFLGWLQGLKTTEYVEGQAPVVILGTDSSEDIETAVIDRAKVIEFCLPGVKECIGWLQENARSLPPYQVRVSTLSPADRQKEIVARSSWLLMICNPQVV